MMNGIIAIRGPDAESFLQGQVTADVNNLPSFGALCNVKGRVVGTFFLFKENDTFYLQLPEEMIEVVINALRKYSLFSKVKLESSPHPSPLPQGERGQYGFTSPLAGEVDAQRRVRGMLPIIYPKTSELFLPQMLNLDKLGAVSFIKGCYLGQEVVARAQNLGEVKRHLYIGTTSEPLPQPGDSLVVETQEIGKVINVFEDSFSAVVQDAFANSPHFHFKPF